MNIIMAGDSITDMRRCQDEDFMPWSYGFGYPLFVESELSLKYPNQYKVYNRGIAGSKMYHVYDRMKSDCFDLNPQLISLLIGINDLLKGVKHLEFKEQIESYIDKITEKFKDVKFILMEPFVLKGKDTTDEKGELNFYKKIFEYADIIKQIALEKKNCFYLPLQEKMNNLAMRCGNEILSIDGIHPHLACSKAIADEWLNLFFKIIKRKE